MGSNKQTSFTDFPEVAVNDSIKEIKPVVKWAGGKRGLIAQYEEHLSEKFGAYYEPFFGGGAIFFHLYKLGKLSKSVVADTNAELMHMYEVIRDNVEVLIQELKNGNYINDKGRFYEVRAWEPEDKIKRAARLIYLNHTCYNGLYRVNKKGKFNVPFGKYSPNVTIIEEENLRLVSKALKDVEILICDFEETVKKCKKNDLVYFDPPYYPLTETADFTSYTSQGFNLEDQIRLAETFRKLSDKSCKVLLSNSHTKKVQELYQGFQQIEIWAKRYINSKPEGRKGVKELLIKNF
ncbi:MAG: DNA adenine methylase [Candidatus Heimdallarchaeota archaeon]|nr:DNA adenine methylase [Candidatus Heimdallarchaeota archaeon]MCK4610573.1 DNA adenine methylase [Candidatus Heimdallarchaeota archaeon]